MACTFAQLPFNGLNASAIESLWLRDTNAEIDGDFGGDTYSAMVPADEENYSDKNCTTNYHTGKTE